MSFIHARLYQPVYSLTQLHHHIHHPAVGVCIHLSLSSPLYLLSPSYSCSGFFFFFSLWWIVFPQLLSLQHNLEHLFTCVTTARGQQVQGLYDRLHFKCSLAGFVCVLPAYKVSSLRGPWCHGLQVTYTYTSYGIW